MQTPERLDEHLDEAAESPTARAERLAWESDRLDEAYAELAADKGISGPKLDEWLRCFAAGQPLPPI